MLSEDRLPKRVFSFDYKPNGKLAQFTIRMRNVPGAMQWQTQTIAKHGVNILSGFTDAPSSAEEAVWSFFADFDHADVEPESLATELRAVNFVLDVQCRASDNGFTADSMHFPVTIGNEPAVIIRTRMLTSIIQKIKELFGFESYSAQVILRQIGQASARAAFEGTRAVTGLDFMKRNTRDAISLYAALGWGLLDLTAIDFDAKTAEFYLKGGFEYTYSRNRSHQSQCFFISGMLAGWTSLLFETNMDVTEVLCQAKGDAFCVFRLQPTKA